MKKIVLAILLISSFVVVDAQTSRLTFGLGGGMSTNMSVGTFRNEVGPMGTFNFGYAILDSVDNEGAMLGLRTGLNVSYSRIRMTTNFNDKFTNTDYDGSQMNYTVVCNNVNYVQQQVNLELPIMFAIMAKGLYFNVGAKLMTPVWNKYEQRIGNTEISVYYKDLGVTIVNDPSTGMLPADQTKISGTATLPRIYIGLSAEIGYMWNLQGNHKLGFDIFVDYTPWGFFGSSDNNRRLVEISPIVNDCEQPKASVKVNPLYSCDKFNFKYINAGLKLVYSFDINHL